MTKFSTSLLARAAMLAALIGAGSAHAVTVQQVFGAHGASGSGPQATTPAATDLTLNLAGQVSYDDQDAPGNTIFTLNALAGSTVNGISYAVTIATVGASWLSEAAILFTNSGGDGVILTAGNGVNNTGIGSYSDSVFLADYGLTFDILSDGVMYVQLFETFDDIPGGADANYTAGSITFAGIGVSAVPEASSYLMMALGLAGIGFVASRRKAG